MYHVLYISHARFPLKYFSTTLSLLFYILSARLVPFLGKSFPSSSLFPPRPVYQKSTVKSHTQRAPKPTENPVSYRNVTKPLQPYIAQPSKERCTTANGDCQVADCQADCQVASGHLLSNTMWLGNCGLFVQDTVKQVAMMGKSSSHSYAQIFFPTASKQKKEVMCLPFLGYIYLIDKLSVLTI